MFDGPYRRTALGQVTTGIAGAYGRLIELLMFRWPRVLSSFSLEEATREGGGGLVNESTTHITHAASCMDMHKCISPPFTWRKKGKEGGKEEKTAMQKIA